MSKVSISDEKPLHMRPPYPWQGAHYLPVSISDEKPLHMRRIRLYSRYSSRKQFQSQMRSRSTCDIISGADLLDIAAVSISDEKPLHMRPNFVHVEGYDIEGFNLR